MGDVKLWMGVFLPLAVCMSVTREGVSPRVAVIGGGLSGLSAALEASKSGSWEVVVLDKEPKLGGNSMKASSGINAAEGEGMESFIEDTRASGGGLSQDKLIETLVHRSEEGIEFLKSYGVDLSGVTRLGGHSESRTHFNPSGPNVGFAIMQKLIAAVGEDSKIAVFVGADVTQIESTERNGRPVYTLHFTHLDGERKMDFGAVVIATGGFGANRTFLERYAKETSVYATTNGPWSTGDGLELGKALGANLVDLEQVQIHPTGFVDPKDPDAGSKILAAEKLRGCGAILLNQEGRRFVDELNRRDHVYGKLSQQTGEKAWLLLSSEGGAMFNVTHMAFYMGRGLITKVDSLEALSAHTNIPQEILKEELETYNAAFHAAEDAFGKKTFPTKFDLDAPIFVAMITPVVHYCMGGIAFNEHAEVLSTSGSAIPGLYAAGEVTGGLHGKNRLGGNSLLDCVVFGRQAGSHAAQYLTKSQIHEEL